MPYPIYIIGQFVPVTYFIHILRGIILRDAGFIDLWQNGAILALMATVVLSIATLRFNKRMA
jgi:ABC-type multidrug transport system permease subunit